MDKRLNKPPCGPTIGSSGHDMLRRFRETTVARIVQSGVCAVLLGAASEVWNLIGGLFWRHSFPRRTQRGRIDEETVISVICSLEIGGDICHVRRCELRSQSRNIS